MAEPTEAAILPFRQPLTLAEEQAEGLSGAQGRLIALAAEGEYLEKAVRDFAVRAGGALDYAASRCDPKWAVPLLEVLDAFIVSATTAEQNWERRP